jgi:hypothetical protein
MASHAWKQLTIGGLAELQVLVQVSQGMQVAS